MYYVYDECIRTDITIREGKCPKYNSKELMASDIFNYPVIGDWDIKLKSGEHFIGTGHLLDIVATYYKDGYAIVKPSSVRNNDAQLYRLPKEIDMHLHLRFIDSRIYELYLDSFVLEYLEGSQYKIDKLECSKQHIHIRGHLK
jgi:predicted Ser/Thr protein kinase